MTYTLKVKVGGRIVKTITGINEDRVAARRREALEDLKRNQPRGSVYNINITKEH